MIQQVVINIMNAGSFFYFIKSSFKGMYKNALMTIASVFVLMACMLIIGSVFLASENVLSFMNKLEAQNEIVAFIDDAYGEDSLSREQLCDKVRAVAGVSDVEYVTREQASPSTATVSALTGNILTATTVRTIRCAMS